MYTKFYTQCRERLWAPPPLRAIPSIANGFHLTRVARFRKRSARTSAVAILRSEALFKISKKQASGGSHNRAAEKPKCKAVVFLIVVLSFLFIPLVWFWLGVGKTLIWLRPMLFFFCTWAKVSFHSSFLDLTPSAKTKTSIIPSSHEQWQC